MIITDANAGLSRRSFLRGASAALVLVTAPALVRASSLMDIRGVPLRDGGFIPCDGQVLPEQSEPGLFKALQDQSRVHHSGIARTFHPDGGHTDRFFDDAGRQYGGSFEERTFAMPDFRPFVQDFGALYLNREGELHVQPPESTEIVKWDAPGDRYE